jgi:hypothetical protein
MEELSALKEMQISGMLALLTASYSLFGQGGQNETFLTLYLRSSASLRYIVHDRHIEGRVVTYCPTTRPSFSKPDDDST